nr:SHOCT domain-containing protein [Streptomyces rubrogriseus]
MHCETESASDQASSAVAPPVQPAAPSSQVSTPVEQLRQLAELRDAGILSEEEFTTNKTEILARM